MNILNMYVSLTLLTLYVDAHLLLKRRIAKLQLRASKSATRKSIQELDAALKNFHATFARLKNMNNHQWRNVIIFDIFFRHKLLGFTMHLSGTFLLLYLKFCSEKN